MTGFNWHDFIAAFFTFVAVYFGTKHGNDANK
jgi:hypothetical protein